MKNFLRLFTICICALTFNVNAQTKEEIAKGIYGDIPDYGQKYLSPDFVKCANSKVYITCRTGNEVRALDKFGKVLNVIPVKGSPSGIAIDSKGNYAYVTIAAPNGQLLKIDLKSNKVCAQVYAHHMPRAVALSKDEKTLYVANQFQNKITAYDSTSLKFLREGETIREPFAITLSKDGKKLYVANQLPESKGGLYEENIACAVSVLDSSNLKKITDILLPNGSINFQDIALSPDGKYAYGTHVVARFNVPTTQVERGWINTNAVSVIDTARDKLLATFLIDDIELGAANPYGVIVSDDGKYLVVAQAGTHEISIINRNALDARIAEKYTKAYKVKSFSELEKNPDFWDRAKSKTSMEVFDDICNDLSFLSGIRRRIELKGLAPRHLDAVGKIAYVGLYYSDTINIVNLENGITKKVSIGGNEVLNEMRKGDLYFHDASLCFQKWLSCATCHTEVRSDGLNWDLLNDGIGNPKQSKSLLYAHFTPPTMITAVRKDAQACVRKGIQYIQFTKRPEEDAVAIDKYMSAMRPVPSPYLNAKGEMNESAKRGEAIFEEAKCGLCHTGEYNTDMKRHNVGSGLDEYKNFAFDTPTLTEIWRTAPYLYDGRARTIYEMMKLYNNENKHGLTKHLSDQDLKDLESYILTF